MVTSVPFKFSITFFSALWTFIQAYSEQHLVSAEILMCSLTKKYVDGNRSLENCLFCEKKSKLLNSCVVLGFVMCFQCPLLQNIFDNWGNFRK